MSRKPFIPNSLKLCTAAQSRQMDSDTISNFGIDGFTLMEIAASRAASKIHRKIKNHKTGLYICGKGNNGGDALAVARYLVNEANHSVSIFMVMGNENLSPDTQKNYSLLKNMNSEGADITFIDHLNDHPPSSFHYIVDGIFGTGLDGDIRSPINKIIDSINQTSTPVFAMDIPSGLNADDGTIHGVCIKADTTYTFGSNKIGFCLNNAIDYTGQVSFIDLPFPDHIRQHEALLINDSLIKHLPLQERNGKHKYDNGVVHIFAGSEGLTGAAMMASKSAWKQGAGAVLLYSPKKLLNLYEVSLPQIIKISLGDDESSHLKPEYSPKILEQLQAKEGVLLIGPGLGSEPETGKCLKQILETYNGSVILDADALRFWDQFEAISKSRKAKWIITPHIGEAKKYLKANFNGERDRINWTKEFTRQHHCSVLLKGNPCIVSTIDNGLYLTGYDTGMFARAGFGDVLAGTFSAKLASSKSIDKAIIHSLITGYKKYCASKPGTVFGPEHLT